VGRRLILDTNVLIACERGAMDKAAVDDDELGTNGSQQGCQPLRSRPGRAAEKAHQRLRRGWRA
jgi:hypothetical protein